MGFDFFLKKRGLLHLVVDNKVLSLVITIEFVFLIYHSEHNKNTSFPSLRVVTVLWVA